MNRSFITATALITSIGMNSCQTATKTAESKEAIISASGVEKVDLSAGVMTPELLNSLARVSSPQVSPDGKRVLYGVSYMDVEENSGNRELFLVDRDGKNKKQLTHTASSERSAVWFNGGKQIAFISSRSGSSQIWIMEADGTSPRQVSDYEGGVDGFKFSPDESRVLFVSSIKYGKRTADVYPDLPKASGRIVGDLMYKHWDEWVEDIPHPFVASYANERMGDDAIDIMAGEPYECPMKPFSGIEDLDWHPDGSVIVYTSRKKEGLEYSVSTNSDIYAYDLQSKKTVNLTEGMMGYDTHPTYSPDGKNLAWISQERDGYESDKKRLYILEPSTGKKTDLTVDFDYNIDALQWKDNGSLYVIACKEAKTHLWEIDLSGKMRQITTGQYDYTSLHLAQSSLVATRTSHQSPADVFSVDPKSGTVANISNENSVLDKITRSRSEERWIKTSDGKQMLTWVVYPPHFDPKKKYPALLYCQGGPQSTVSQFFSFRWNFEMMAAQGYIVVAPNRRGLPGFGQEWLEQISGDYGGQNMKDYLAAIDEVSKEPFVDEERLGAVGASYGGFSVYWLAGNHDKRFKAFISHAGIFNLEQQYLETEEMWFANWDMGGAYWDKDNKTAQRTYANSPHRFVDRWDTPILVTHGELDYRILASQGMSAFNAAKLRGIPAEMLVYPDENHWIAQPQNGVLFQRVFFRWLDRWLKTDTEK